MDMTFKIIKVILNILLILIIVLCVAICVANIFSPTIFAPTISAQNSDNKDKSHNNIVKLSPFSLNNNSVNYNVNVTMSDDNLNVKPIKATMKDINFIKKISSEAIETHIKSGIFASITIAQAMIESGTGSSGLTTKSNNLFGIKDYDWTGKIIQMRTEEYLRGGYINILAPFRAYVNWNDSIEDHANFLIENSTYKTHGVFISKTYQEQAQALQNAGYSTNPNYAKLLVTLIKEYSLNKYDTIKTINHAKKMVGNKHKLNRLITKGHSK